MELACTPNGHPLKRSLLLVISPPQRKPRGAAPSKPARQQGQDSKAGSGDRESAPHVVGVTDEGNTSRMRLAAAAALGQLGVAWPEGGS